MRLTSSRAVWQVEGMKMIVSNGKKFSKVDVVQSGEFLFQGSSLLGLCPHRSGPGVGCIRLSLPLLVT